MAVAISGNTYPVKDQLRAMGGKWDADRKAWMVPESSAERAQALVAGATKSAPRAAGSSRSGYGGSGYGSRCKGCRGPIADARHHRAMGGYCGSCAFDEYDM